MDLVKMDIDVISLEGGSDFWRQHAPKWFKLGCQKENKTAVSIIDTMMYVHHVGMSNRLKMRNVKWNSNWWSLYKHAIDRMKWHIVNVVVNNIKTQNIQPDSIVDQIE